MVLSCGDCGSLALEIVHGTSGERTAFEVYECEDCGNRGTLHHDGRRTKLDGLESIDRRETPSTRGRF